MTPDAKPAIFGPPISIAAAVPKIEWVALAVKEIRIRNKTTESRVTYLAAQTITQVSRRYRAAATGARLPLKKMSDTNPDTSDPSVATSGMPNASIANLADFRSTANSAFTYR